MQAFSRTAGQSGFSNASESQKLWSANRPGGDNSFRSRSDVESADHGRLLVDDQYLKEYHDKLRTTEDKSMPLNGLNGLRRLYVNKEVNINRKASSGSTGALAALTRVPLRFRIEYRDQPMDPSADFASAQRSDAVVDLNLNWCLC
jgi:hypothetical protein